MSPAALVLAHYPAPLRGPITPLGNHGGFSGAVLFRVQSPDGTLCLRGWPGDIPAVHLGYIHGLMHRATAAGLDYVPRVFATSRGDTHVDVAGRLWELTSWMPGAPALRQPAPGLVDAALAALARLHVVWAEAAPRHGVCPAVERRLAIVRDWATLLESRWHPPADPDDPVAGVAHRACMILRDSLALVAPILAPWLRRSVPLQPCLCDVWHDHVLFTDDRVTGLVDFGSVKVDSVAVDLARLLGSLPPDSAPLAGRAGSVSDRSLAVYHAIRPLSTDEQALVADLQRTGTVIAVANWLRWLYREHRTYRDLTAVAGRLAGLLERLQ